MLYLLLLLPLCGVAEAQQRLIRGRVLDGADQAPLVGATIQLSARDAQKYKGVGTTTDAEGRFSLSVPNEVKTLQVSYIGYTTQTLALSSGKGSYELTLFPSDEQLNALVVTGYQTLEKRRLTASVAKLNVSESVLGSAKSIDQALAGQIAGVAVTSATGTPGAPARIRIRGTASLNGTQDPLWVLDGIPLEGTDIPKLDGNNDNDILNIGQSSIAGVNPQDIENITILKDAAATAIYGARAANGVILITTKKGQSGKPSFNFSSRLSYSPRLSDKRLNLLNASQKVDLELQLLREPEHFLFGLMYPEKGGVADILRSAGLLASYRADGASALTPEALSAINALRGINTDWSDILFKDAFTQEYSLSISGGTEQVKYYNSLGYTNENGNVPGVGMKRFNLTTKTTYQPNKLLKLGASLLANRRTNVSYVTDKNGNINPVYYSRVANPYQRIYGEGGAYIYDYNVIRGQQPDLTRGFNIFQERANTNQSTATTALNAIFDAELRFLPELKFSTQLGLQWEQSEQDEFIGWDTYTMRDLYQNSAYYERGQQKFLVPQGGRHKVGNRVLAQATWKGILEYKKSWSRIHDVQLMLGSEIRRNKLHSTTTTAWGYDPKTLASRPILARTEDEARAYPQHLEILTRNAFASFFANGSYSLLNRYTLGASVRLDGSDLFGVDRKYRYLPIYSLSALWRLSNESFLSDVKWLDNFALRASYGLQGNIDKNTSPYLVGTYSTVSPLPGASESIITINSAPNSKLRWEKTTSYNLGLDLAILSNRINLSADYYQRKGTDLIASQSLPLENGFSSMTINWAEMTNQGVELSLQTRNIVAKDFSWTTTLNFAYNQNKVLRVMTPENQTTPSLAGYPVGAIFAIPTKGISSETGQILIDNGDGSTSTIEQKFKLVDETGMGFYASEITPAEERAMYRYAGTSDAPFTGGLLNTLSYKGWELSINLAYYLGAHVRTAPSYSVTDFDTGRNVNQDILERWTPENTTATRPALATRNNLPADYSLLNDRPQVYRNMDFWVKPLNYFRLQNLRLGYNLPSSWLKGLGIKGATLALEGRNLFVLGSSYRNYLDPESMSNLYATPVPKTLTFHINLNF